MLPACGKAPFYCVCQGQSGKRYVRNSHVSCPHSSIGAAVPLPAETQKANLAFISLQMQPGYFYSCIVRRVQRQGETLQPGEAAQLPEPARAAGSGRERRNRLCRFLLHLGRLLPAAGRRARSVRLLAFRAGAPHPLVQLSAAPWTGCSGVGDWGRTLGLGLCYPLVIFSKGLACFLRHTSCCPFNTKPHKHQNFLLWLEASETQLFSQRDLTLWGAAVAHRQPLRTATLLELPCSSHPLCLAAVDRSCLGKLCPAVTPRSRSWSSLALAWELGSRLDEIKGFSTERLLSSFCTILPGQHPKTPCTMIAAQSSLLAAPPRAARGGMETQQGTAGPTATPWDFCARLKEKPF